MVKRTWRWVDAFVLMLIYAYLTDHVPFKLLFLNSITTGGDTASHYPSLVFMKEYLLPRGKLVGWSMGNYGGFPVFIFYFPLLFFIGALLSFLVPITVAFKIISIIGVLMLPICTYIMLRAMKLRDPAPILGALGSLPFLFNESHSMWGGNFLSNYAGEFTYAFSFALTFVLLGFLFGILRDESWSLQKRFIGKLLIGIGLTMAIVMSHGFTIIICVVSSTYFLLRRKEFVRNTIYLGLMFGIAFCLASPWLMQLYFNSPFTTEFNIIWTFGSLLEIFPIMLMPFQALFLIATLIALWNVMKSRVANSPVFIDLMKFSWFLILMSIVSYFSSETLKLPDVRFIPFAQFVSVVMGLAVTGFVFDKIKSNAKYLLPVICFFALVVWLLRFPSGALPWAKWNYNGIEATTNWSIFADINRDLKGDESQPRVIYEHNAIHQSMGTPRAFEALPLHSGRSTLEGLYFQSSLLSPAVFYLQSLYSKEISCPFPDFPCTHMNYEKAYRYLELFNSDRIIVVSPEAQSMVKKLPQYYEFIKQYGRSSYQLWRIKTKHSGYVEKVTQPVKFTEWRNIRNKSYNWLRNYEGNEPFLISTPDLRKTVYSFPQLEDIGSLQKLKQTSVQNCKVNDERVIGEEVSFKTSCIGQPILIKVAYHPGWEVEGALGPYFATPGFMMVYPTSEHVSMRFLNSRPVNFGRVLFGFACFVLAGVIWAYRQEKLRFEQVEKQEKKLNLIFISFSVVAALLLIIQIFNPGYHRSFKMAEVFYTARQFSQASQMFQATIEKWPDELTLDRVHFFHGLSLMFNEEKEKSIQAFRKIAGYKDSEYLAESHYHIGTLLMQLGKYREAEKEFKVVIEKIKDPRWIKNSKDRLNECRTR